jgi:ATP-dependent RNA helicase DeaD
MALFSATMPREIERIARRHLREPRVITVKALTTKAALIRQRYWPVSNFHKLDALTRILEVEPFDALLMFVRTRIATTELAEKLEARGYSAAALNGDMAQKLREQTISRLKKGTLDIIVATDVAARGLDVDRISHVVNYDIPYDVEAYIHRIGRTGRAGRQGDAILFVAPRERRMLFAIENATQQKIEQLELPSNEVVNEKRIADFKLGISETLAAGDLDFLQGLLQQYQNENNVPAIQIAAALAKLSIGDKPWLLKKEHEKPLRNHEHSMTDSKPRKGPDSPKRKPKARPSSMQRFRIEVGHDHGVKPGNIVGAIANEANLDAQYIGNIAIQADHSIVDLPKGMPGEVFELLKDARVCGHRMNLSRYEGAEQLQPSRHKPGGKKPGFRKPGSGKTENARPKTKKAGAKKRKNKGKRTSNAKSKSF